MPLIPRRALAALASTVVLAGALAAPALLSSADAAPAAPAARAAQPTVGTCYKMTGAQSALVANQATVVGCAKKHTARAIVVATFPKSVDLKNAKQVDAFVSKKCSPVYKKVVGLSAAGRALTTYEEVFFLPTKKEISKGDRTLECDLVLRAGHDLAPLPTDKEPALKGRAPYADSVRLCYDQTRKDFLYTVCARRHDYRSTSDFKLAGAKYPSDRAFQRAASRRCGSTSYFVKPTETQWDYGYRYTICVDKTSR